MLLHRSLGAAHVVHQHHAVRDQVQVDADARLDVGVHTDPAAGAGFGEVQLVTQVQRDGARAARDSAESSVSSGHRPLSSTLITSYKYSDYRTDYSLQKGFNDTINFINSHY